LRRESANVHEYNKKEYQKPTCMNEDYLINKNKSLFIKNIKDKDNIINNKYKLLSKL